jgi:transposase-like protein
VENLKHVAEQVGVSRGSLYKWKNQLLGHDAPASMKRKQGAPAGSDRADLEQQLETLRQDIWRLQLEKDLLQKANELLKNELGIDQQPLTNREKTLARPACASTASPRRSAFESSNPTLLKSKGRARRITVTSLLDLQLIEDHAGVELSLPVAVAGRLPPTRWAGCTTTRS